MQGEHTLAHAVDEASHHEDRVKVPLLLQVYPPRTSPGKWKPLAILPAELNDPIQDQGEEAMEEDLGCQEQKSKTTFCYF